MAKVVITAGDDVDIATERDLIRFIEETIKQVGWTGYDLACHVARNLLDSGWVDTIKVDVK